MKKLLHVALLASIMSISGFAQNISIKKVELAGEKIIVHYDLEDSNPGNEYKLDLYASKDNYAAPLTKVKGDVGAEIKPGVGRKIEWSVREELGGYKGRLALEIRGKVYIPFVKLQNFSTNQSYKRGKTYTLNMKAGNSNPIHVELFKGGQRVSGENNHPNNGSYALSVPASAKPGKDYRLKITDSKNGEEVIFSPFFQVKPKFPLLLKVVPVMAIGGLIAALSGGGGGSKEATVTPDPEITLPPAPGN